MHKVKIYLILLSLLLCFSLLALVFVVLAFSPEKNSSLAMFYSFGGLSVFASTTLAGFYLRRLFGHREFQNSYISAASRQGIWFALIFAISMILVSQNIFSWINTSLLVMTFVFFESYLLTKDKIA